MLRFARQFGARAWARWLTRIFFLRDHSILRQSYHGLTFNNPVGVAAGFDKNAETVPVMASLGFGFMEVGSVTARRCAGNPRPWFYRLPKTKSIVVHVGLANQGSKTVIRQIEGYKDKLPVHFPVILSVAKTNSPTAVTDRSAIEDYVASIKRARGKQSISMIEINISCPNTYGGEPFTTPDRLDRLLQAVDEVGVAQPIFIKMPSDLPWRTFKSLLDVILRHSIAGVTIANLVKHRNHLKDELPPTVQGGLSGRPTWDTSNELIRRTYKTCGDRLTIIGVGGVFTADDAYTKIRLGASLIELITGMIFEGPQIAAAINADLSKLLQEDGYMHISEAIGVDAG